MSISLQSDNLSTPLVVPSYFDWGSILFAERKGAERGTGRRNDEVSALARGLSAFTNVVK